MKVIVTGATGTAGQAVVKQCFEDERITSVIVLTRKAVPLDIESHPKAQVVMHQDFSHYTEETMRRLEGAEACLWAIGGKVSQFNHDKQLCRKVNVDYTLAAANAMVRHLADKTPSGTKFRFVLCSGRFAERNQQRSLFFKADTRRIKGEVERGLCELADTHADRLDVWILRPSGFMAPDAPLVRRVLGRLYGAIQTAQLGKAMVTVGCQGWKDRTIENDVLLRM